MIDKPLHEVLDWNYYARLAELSPEALRMTKLGGLAFRLAGRESEILVGFPPAPSDLDETHQQEWLAEFAYKRLQILRFLAMIRVRADQLGESDADVAGSN